MASDDTCKVYVYKSEGKLVGSRKPPPSKRSSQDWVVESNRTYGNVCLRTDVWIIKETLRLQRQLDAANTKAEDQCQREVRDGITKERNDVLEPALKEAGDRWTAAANEMNEARADVTRSIEELNNLQRLHDMLHRGLSLVLDVTSICVPEWGLALALVNLANHVTEGVHEVREGEVGKPLLQGGTATFAHGTDVYAEHIQEEELRGLTPEEAAGYESEVPEVGMGLLKGAILVQDIVNLFRDIDTFPFTNPNSLEAVQSIREAFAERKWDWTQKWFGTKPKELDAKFQKLEDAIKKEQEARKAFNAAMDAAHGDPYAARFGTCVQKKMAPIKKQHYEALDHLNKQEYQEILKGPY